MAIILVGIFLRANGAVENFLYSHDQDLLGWFVRDVVENSHLRLIGQETSQQGVFVGPVFYYLMVPFYLLFAMDPVGGLIGVITLSAFTLGSLYFVVSKIFGRQVGIGIAFLYSVSLYSILNDREVVPTGPIVLWTVWFLFSLYSILKKNSKGFYLAAFLLGLAWNINLSLILFAPLVFMAWYFSKAKLKLPVIIKTLAITLITFAPYILFDLKHGLRLTKAILLRSTTSQIIVQGSGGDFERVITLLSKNIANILGVINLDIKHQFWLVVVLLVFVLLIKQRIFSKELAILLVTWLVTPIIFFSLNPIILSEYYLNGLTLFWFLVLAVFVGSHRRLGIVVLITFASINLLRYSKLPVNKSGYLERKEIVHFIKNDSIAKGYPCVAISYITKPGYDFGYRYFYYLEDFHVNSPKSGSPVYTIVYPLRQDITTDKTFGAIGLILPDYQRYGREEINKSCSGENSNLTDPMFGFPQ